MKVREVITPNSVPLQASVPVMEAAKVMSQHNMGDVIVQQDGKICGIVTDRDIVVRALAEGKDPKTTTLDSICSQKLTTISPDQTTAEAVRLMRERSIRRLPVVEDGKELGIVSLGDLTVELDRNSALRNISAAPANN